MCINCKFNQCRTLFQPMYTIVTLQIFSIIHYYPETGVYRDIFEIAGQQLSTVYTVHTHSTPGLVGKQTWCSCYRSVKWQSDWIWQFCSLNQWSKHSLHTLERPHKTYFTFRICLTMLVTQQYRI